MIAIPTYIIVVVGVVLLWLVFKLFEYKSRMAKPETVYIDTSGIASNPPKFIDVLQNKTVNFLIDKEKIVISQLGIGKCLTTVNKIAELYRSLKVLVEYTPENRTDEIKTNILKASVYKQIINQIYTLSKPFCKNKRKYKKALHKEAKRNIEKVLLITEQIYDYWIYVKKLLALLAQGGSRRMTIGENYTWNSLEMDTTGQTIIKPRFVLSMN